MIVFNRKTYKNISLKRRAIRNMSMKRKISFEYVKFRKGRSKRSKGQILY